MLNSPRHLLFLAPIALLLALPGNAQEEVSQVPSKAPADGMLWKIGADMKIEELRPAKIVKLSAGKLEDGTPAIQLDIPATDGYHGLHFPVPSAGWDFTGFEGIQVDVTNASADTQTSVFLEIGGPKLEEGNAPQILTSKQLEPGETETISISFDATIERPEGEFDRAHVKSIRVNGAPCSEPMTLLLTEFKAY